MATIAIIEDEKDILDVLKYNVKREGHDVVVSMRGDEGLELVRKQKPDLILLDLMLPGLDGLEVCKQLRKDSQFETTPIIMLTAKSEETDTVLGLGLGADDYVTKPFSSKELMARIKANLRISLKSKNEHDSDGSIKVDGLEIDKARHKVSVNAQEIKLTASEFRLLYALARKAGRVFTREKLLGEILTDHAVIVDRNVDVHIRAVRKKLDTHAYLIETVRGVGYRFKDLY